MTELERLQVVIEANTKPLQQELNKVNKSMDSLEKSVSKSSDKIKRSFTDITVAVTAIGYAAKKAIGFIGGMVTDAQSMQAQSKNLSMSLGENAQSFIEWARTGASAFGISEAAAISYGNTFGSIISNFERDTSKISGYTQSLLSSAAVVASKTGRTIEDVLGRLRSGLMGQTEAIEDLGIFVNVSALTQTEAFRRIAQDQSWSQLTYNQQQAIRYFAIMEQSGIKYGTSLDPAMQKQLMFSAQLKNLKTNIGEAFLPILSVVIPILQHLIKWLGAAIQFIGAFFGIFGGKDTNKGSKTIQNGANAASSIASDLSAAEGSAGGVGSGIAKGAKEAKKIKTLLAGFDKLNILSQETSDTTGAGGPVSGGDGGGGVSVPGIGGLDLPDMSDLIGDYSTELDGLSDKFEGIAKVVAGLGIALAALWVVKKVMAFSDAVSKVLTAMGFLKGGSDGAATGMSNFKSALGLTVIGIIGMVASLATIVTKWQEMDTWQKILSGSLLLVSGALTAVGITAMVTGTSIATAISAATLGVGALIAGVLGAIAVFANWVISSDEVNVEMKDVELQAQNLETALDNLRNATSNNMNAVDNYESSLKTLEEAEQRLGISGADLEAQVKSGTLTYQDMTAEQREVYKAYVNTKDAEDKLNDSQEELTQSTKDATLADYKHRLSLAHTSGEYDDYKKSVMEAYDQGMLSAEEARDLISGAMADMSKDSRQTFVKDLPSDITNGLNPNKYSTAATKLENKFGDMWENVKETAGNIWEDILDFFSEGGKIFDGIKDGIVGAFKTIVNSLIGGINKVIAFPFNKINGLLNTIRDISVLGMKPFSGFWGYNPLPVPQIPKLATGTNYIQREGLAYLHEGEAVVPKKYNPALGGGNNKEQIALLVEQNKLLTAILNKETDIRLDGQKVNQTLSKADYRRQRSLGLAR